MSPTDPINAGLENILSRQIQAEREAEQTLAALCPQLTELGVKQVEITYDGYSDEGTVDNVIATAGKRQIELSVRLSEALADAAESLLPCGWEDNEGAYGRLILNVTKKRVRREHNWRVASSVYEEETIDL